MNNQIIDGRYKLQKKLGEGAMGIVYKGEIIANQQTVAIKALKPQAIHENPTRLERFIREADALYQLEHPHIVRVIDTIKYNNLYFIVMEYMAGGSLRSLMDKEGKLPIKFTVETALDLSDALVRTHRLKIIHRDVKPDNVLLNENGIPRLTDFGAAHIANADALTAAGAYIGTMHYMAPEILLGQEISAKVDVWSFGIVLYEMLTGFTPFMGSKLKDLVMAILKQPVPTTDKLRPDTPARLATLIDNMLQKDAAKRTSSMRHVGLELEEILEAMP
jgi:eukaryotic-like serine/threonine-protein kinase